MKAHKFFTLFVVLMLILSACGPKATEAPQATEEPQKTEEVQEKEEPTEEKTEEPTPEALEEVTLKIMLPGDRPAQMDAVIAEAEKRMAEEGLNIKLDVVFVPWGADLQNISVSLAAGEEIDLAFDAPWLNIEQNISQGFYLELEDLLEEYGPNVWDTRPEMMWEANKFNGKIYGLPLGFSHWQGRSWLIRKDLREEMGFEDLMDNEKLEPASFEQFEEFLYAAKQAYPDMIPLSGNVGHLVYHDFDTSLRGISAPDFEILYRKGNDGKVYNMFDDPDPWVMDLIYKFAQWRQDGLLPKEAATGDEYQIGYGKVIAQSTNDFGVNAQVIADVESLGGEVEWITFMDPDKKRIVNFQQWNFICIPYTSPNPERAMMFLNWAHQQENYDLLAYGIEGKNWEPVGENEYRPLEDQYRWYPYAWIWNPTLDRLNADAAPGANLWNRWSMDADNFEPDILIGWNPDNEPVVNEVSQLNALRDQYWTPLTSGLVDDVDTWWAEYESEAVEYARIVQEEYNRQIDEFLGR